MVFGRRDVPLDKDASARFLPWLIGLMVYLAALALAAGIAISNLAERWDTGLAGQLTVQVPPSASENGDGDHAARVEAALDVLRAAPGIRRAEVLDEGHVQALLEPWLGDAIAGEDLPIPALIAAELDPRHGADLSALRDALRAAAPGAVVDDHQRTLGELLDAARTVQLLTFLIMALVAGAAAVTVTFATRTGLAVHRHVIELLHLIGAHDHYVARQFQSHALKLALTGGVGGLALATATLLGMNRFLAASGSAVIPDLYLSVPQWGFVGALPVVAALLAMLTARVTVLRTLARLS